MPNKIQYKDLTDWLELKIKKESDQQYRLKKEGVAEYYVLERLRALHRLLDRLGEGQYDLLMSDVVFTHLTDEQTKALENLTSAYEEVRRVMTPPDAQ